MIPSMSRPANPYDNASCESFVKTLKREEIYANDYRTLEHLATNIEKFIERVLQSVSLTLGARLPATGGVRTRIGVRNRGERSGRRSDDHGFSITASVTTNQVMTQWGTVLDDERARRGDPRLAAVITADVDLDEGPDRRVDAGSLSDPCSFAIHWGDSPETLHGSR